MFSKRPRYASKEVAGARLGFRSGLEKVNADALTKLGVAFDYEKHKVRFVHPARIASYTPDFYLTHNGIIVETKGLFSADDRAKHILVKEQHPDLDVRFVFSSETTRLYAGSPTTYAKWCTDHGFTFARKTIPLTWLNERPQKRRIEALIAAASTPDINLWAIPAIRKAVKG